MTRQLSEAQIAAFRAELRAINPLRWKSHYGRPDILDGAIWTVQLTTASGISEHSGRNSYPRTWERLRRLIERTTGPTFL